LTASAAGVRAPSDRRYRRPDVPPVRRRRRAQWVRRAGKGAAIGVAALGATVWLGSAVLGSSWLDVKGIRVRGNNWLSTGEVEGLVAGVHGQNILAVDLDEYRRRLLDSPWVATVTLYRTLPSTIEVEIVERMPMALARLGRRLYLVDDAGVIIDEFGPEYREFDLPIVDGLVLLEESGGPLVHPDRIRLTSRFLRAVAEHPDLERRISQIDVSNARDVVALIDVDPVLLHLGDEDFAARLETYLEYAPTLRDQFADIEYVDLRFDEWLYVGSAGRTALARSRVGDGQSSGTSSQGPNEVGSPVEGRDGT
jgi:cell division protein FtsQ